MVRFLRRHSLDKNSAQHSQFHRQLSHESSSSSDTAEMHEPHGNGSGGTPPLPNGRAAAAGAPRSRLGRDGPPSDLDVMKERFAKLLLGEDMSGTGKGVSSALALSNAITNLAASVFGEHRKLEPMAPDTKERWKKEVGWLLSVTDHVVEFVPTSQTAENGTTMEIMSTAQRRDLQMNIPALRKLDAMLIGYMDNFVDQSEFWYEKGGDNKRDDDKWWMPTVKVPAEGLSEVTRKWLQYQKECVNQVLKAAMAINAQVLVEMEIPEVYIESLPKKGKTSLGDAIYRSITDEEFDPLDFLEGMDLSTEHKVLDLKNRIEASTVIWKRKMQTKQEAKSSWGSIISFEKREQFEERAETILHLLKLQFPGTPQSQLDISKIQYNRVSTLFLAINGGVAGRGVRDIGELLEGAGEPGVQRDVEDRGRAGGGRGGAEPDGDGGSEEDDGRTGRGGGGGKEAGRQGGAGEAQRGAGVHDALRLHGVALRPGRAHEEEGGRHPRRGRRGQAQEGAQPRPQEVLLRRQPLRRRHEEPLRAPLIITTITTLPHKMIGTDSIAGVGEDDAADAAAFLHVVHNQGTLEINDDTGVEISLIKLISL